MDFSLNKILTVPNLLSLSRILLVPFIGWFLFQDTVSGALWAGLLLVISISTDFLDGFFARLLNQVSDLGKILDPLADKIFVGVLVIELIFLRDFPVWIAVILVAKDVVIIVASALIAGKKKLVLPSNIIGKYAFGMQAGLILSYFLKFEYGILSFTILTLAFVFMSILSYGKIMLYILKNKESEGELTVPASRQYIPSWLRLSLTFLLAVAFFFQLYYWSFENNEVTSPEILTGLSFLNNSAELAENYAPVLYGEEGRIVNAEEYFNSSKKKTGPRYFHGLLDTTAKANVPESYIVSSEYLEEGLKSQVYFTCLELDENDHGARYFLQYWVFFGSETKPVSRAGDWQMAGVYLSSEKKPLYLVLTQGWYARIIPWGEVQRINTHPLVFIGNESNSFYPTSGKGRIYLDQEMVISLGEEAVGKDEYLLSPKGYDLVELDGEAEWVKWQGRWSGPLPGGGRGPFWWNPKNSKLAPMQNPLSFLTFYLVKRGEG